MGFREVGVVEIREVLRLWLRGRSARWIGRAVGMHRETVARYVEAAKAAGCDPSAEGGEEQLTDALVAAVVEAVRPARPGGRGKAWERAQANREFIEGHLKNGVPLVKVRRLLHRERGVEIPYPTLHRFAVACCGFGRRRTTVRVADGEPGSECQVDFGRVGLIPDGAGRRRLAWGLVFTACYSRHQFVFLTYRQTLDAVIEGFERAWVFFGGVFRVVIPDNIKAIVVKADPIAPSFNDSFLEYAQSRGFEIDPARVRRPQDKPRVERAVPYVRGSFFAGECFADLADAQSRVEAWCLVEAGLRIHRTTQRRPREVFEAEERGRLLPVPERPFDVPVWKDAKVHRDYHIEVERALYSVPHAYLGEQVRVRADSALVKIFHRGRLIKVHPRAPRGGRHTDPTDYPEERRAYAMRDVAYLRRVAASHGPHVGDYAARLLDGPLPWTKMRQVYRLLGLARREAAACDEACRQALELDVVDVGRIARMLEHHLPAQQPSAGAAAVVQLRFAREAAEFTPRGDRP
jgi:transposase